MALRITSLSNPRVKELVRLQTESASRRESGLFCLESARELRRAVDAGLKPVELYVCEKLLGSHDPSDWSGLGVEPIAVEEAVLRKVAYREKPEGFVAVMREPERGIGDVKWDGRELLIVCSGVEKPGNIGAILRSADAAGVTAVLIDTPSFDLYNPNCVRSSTGAVFTTVAVRATRHAIREALGEHGVTLVAATPEAPTDYTDADFTKPVALILGAEAAGLDPYWRDASDLAVGIPQRGKVDSLNVSVTAAVVMFEAARQRRNCRA